MHRTVLLKEAIDLLEIGEGDFVVDATAGAGGHTVELAKKVGSKGIVLAIDVDRDALDQTKKRINEEIPQLANIVLFANDNFVNIKNVLEELDVNRVPDAILADLGWRIEQIEGRKYGMSFQEDFPLDMRLGEKMGEVTAKDIVNFWEEEKLADLFWVYADERASRKIAKKIVEARKESEIETTKELAEIVADAKKSHREKINPATKVFQALRIVVNDELGNLKKFVDGSVDCLKEGGRLAIISFHSLEDKEVKNIFRTNARGCVCPKGQPVCNCGSKQKTKIITKKPVRPSLEEQRENPRSRSAKLRVVEKIQKNNIK